MRAETAAALRRINRRFYDRHAAAFSARREAPWPGWRRVAAEVERRRDPSAPVSVLDLGCGNARLASFLEDRWPGRLVYLGVDESAALLEIAAVRLGGRPGHRLLLHDLLEPLPERLPGAPFDLVALFGLMHHMPGVENRLGLLRRAAEGLAPGGLLAVSFWQFGERRRFRRRELEWAEYNRTAREPIDTAELEPGDRLLLWGEQKAAGAGSRALRYCSWTPPAAADDLLAGLSLEPLAAFSADGEAGDLNYYRLLRRG